MLSFNVPYKINLPCNKVTVTQLPMRDQVPSTTTLYHVGGIAEQTHQLSLPAWAEDFHGHAGIDSDDRGQVLWAVVHVNHILRLRHHCTTQHLVTSCCFWNHCVHRGHLHYSLGWTHARLGLVAGWFIYICNLDQTFFFFFFYILFTTVLFQQDFSRGKFGLPSPGKASCSSRATQPMVYAGCFRVSIIHQTLTWTVGSSTCAQM